MRHAFWSGVWQRWGRAAVAGVVCAALLGAAEATAKTPNGNIRPLASGTRAIPPAGGCTTPGGGPVPRAVSGGLVPQQLAAAYGVTPLWQAGFQGQGRRIALIEVGQTLNPALYAQESQCFGPWPAVYPHVVGGSSQPTPGGEASLDAQNVASIAPLSRVDMFESVVDDTPSQLAPLINAALNPANTGGQLVDTISMSVGTCEKAWPPGEFQAVESALQRAANLGVAVFTAEGDQGSSGWYTQGQALKCVPHPVPTAPYRLDRCGATGVAGAPGISLGIGYPGSSPFVTAVGGTELQVNGFVPPASDQNPVPGSPNGGTITAEVVWNQHAPAIDKYRQTCGWPSLYFAGGGGTSTQFTTTTASWQNLIGLSGAERKPDIAALAGWPNYLGYAFGTSGAAPLMAGAVAVLDGYLVANHRKTTGPLNPTLYAVAAQPNLYRQVFNDVVNGSNDLLGLGCCSAGPGYDEASGLGSVNIAQLAQVLLTAGQFTVTSVKSSADGTVTLALKLPGPGVVSVLETAPQTTGAHAAAFEPQASKGRFVFARKGITVTGPSSLRVTARPNGRGRRLVADRGSRVKLRLWVSFIPTIGGTRWNVGFYGVGLNCKRRCGKRTKLSPVP
jgi:subtilase family serine protease